MPESRVRVRKGKSSVGDEGSQEQEGRIFLMIRLAKTTLKKSDSAGAVGGAPQRPNHSVGQSFEVLGEYQG